MGFENADNFSPDELIDSWNSMSSDEKIGFVTNPSTDTIDALTKFLEEFNKSNKSVEDLRKDRNDALIELLKKGDRPTGEIKEIVDLIDKGIKEAADDKDRNNDTKLKVVVIAGGIASIIAGAVAPKLDGKTRTAMIAVGSAALVGALGSETKMGKAIINSLVDTQNKEAVNPYIATT